MPTPIERNPVMIRCRSCGAPARYDILRRDYGCKNCGGRVTLSEAAAEKRGFRECRLAQNAAAVKELGEQIFECGSCSAKVVVPAGEALGSCAFCGGTVVRREYALGDDLPEVAIPFALTREEAAARLEAWCDENNKAPEAKILRERIAELRGYYLPYRLVKGGAEADIATTAGARHYTCRAELPEIAVNTSGQLDNGLLDAVEPFDWGEAAEFDFGMVAGYRVKLADISDGELLLRTSREVEEDLRMGLREPLHAQGIEAAVNVKNLLTMNAALPMYLLDTGKKRKVKAAINGQTGRVAVTKLKPRVLDLAVLETVLTVLGLFLVPFLLCLFVFRTGMSYALTLSTMLALCFGLLVVFIRGDRVRGAALRAETLYRTPEVTALREGERIIFKNVGPKERKERPVPVLVEELKSTGVTPVTVAFFPAGRVAGWIAAFLALNGAPVLLALLLNGFDFSKLQLSGSAVWWCLSVPVCFLLYMMRLRSSVYNDPVFCYAEGKKQGRRVPKSELAGYTRPDIAAAVKEYFSGPILLTAGLPLLLLGVLFICAMLTGGLW